MNIYTIELTDIEVKALEYVAISAQDWIENAVKGRCQAAMQEIFQMEYQRMMADPNVTQMPANLETFVEQANIESLAQRVANQQPLNDGPTGS
jgi:hypothetical protein